MAAKTTRAIAYIRSNTPTDDDTASRINIAAQRISAHCELSGITLMEMIVDEGSVGRLALGVLSALSSFDRGARHA